MGSGTRRLKQRITLASPFNNSVFGYRPSNSCALPISGRCGLEIVGRQWVWHSPRRRARQIDEVSANSRMLNSPGLPRFSGQQYCWTFL
jgi:hypothetical protein